ncbi:MAG: HAMP domain-containing sensor histidine kinase [Bryobacteraceae bacterium]|nr:HAMP domain-containing sensor histidine kinase [Bryobacteraceae bacterium]
MRSDTRDIAFLRKLASAADRPAVLIGGSAALLVLLITIAVLQYRWIGQVSDAERTRLRARLQESSRAFTDEFDGAFLEIAQQVLAPRGPIEAPEERLRVWLEFARYPRLIQAFFVVEGESVRSVPTADGRTVAVENVPEPLRELLTADGGPPRFGPGPPVFERRGFFALVTPRGRFGPPRFFRPDGGPLPGGGRPPRSERRPEGPRPPDGPEARAWTVAVIDLNYVNAEFLPALVRRHFGPDWYVAVRSLRDDRIVFSTSPGGHKAELTVPLLEARGGGGRPLRESRWQLEVAPATGTLEELVAGVRTRNLALSLAALGLLAAAIVLLIVSLERARRLGRLRMELVAGVSHELRTPVAVIVSAADNLADGVVSTPDQIRRYGQTLRREGLRLSEMVEEVLGFAGLDAGRVRLQVEPVPPMAIVDNAAEACRHELEASGCRLDIDVADDAPPVAADLEWLSRCLRNLISNAIRYGDGKWVGLQVTARTGTVDFSVEDHGEGIAAHDLPNLFKPFHRGRNARNRNAGGAGLGLSLVERIARAHGGSVAVDTARARGTRFTLSIPKADAPA